MVRDRGTPETMSKTVVAAASQTCKRKKTAIRQLVVVRGLSEKVKDNRNGKFRNGLGGKEHDERKRDHGEEVGGNNED